MITEATLPNQEFIDQQQRSWMQITGTLPEIDVLISHSSFGTNFGMYSICTDTLSPGAIIYSFGVGKEISFEKELQQVIPCELHLFDPTPASIAWISRQNLPESFSFHPYGLSHKDQFIHLYPPKSSDRTSHSIIKHKWAADSAIRVSAKSLSTIAEELHHNHIDVLKMDVEGAEYDVIKNLNLLRYLPGQIIVEFHHHYPEIGVLKTERAIRQLRDHGYKLFDYSAKLEEFSFILDGGKLQG